MPNTGRLLSEFITLFVTIGQIDTAAVFLGVTSGVHRPPGSIANSMILGK